MGTGLDWFSLSGAGSVGGSGFGDLLASLSAGSSNVAPIQGDPLAQLTNLVQNGTSLQTITDSLVQSVTDALQKQLGGSLSQDQIERIRSSIANALAPPGNGPPGTPTDQVRALAARLRRLIETIARETTTGSGQTNDISGKNLDATTARGLPAHERSNAPSESLDVSSLVRSLLATVAQSLTPHTGGGTLVHGSYPGGSSSVSTQPVRTVTDPTQHVLGFGPLVHDAAPASASVDANASPSTAAGNASLPHSGTNPAAQSYAQPITMADAPDLLARMVIRAAGADAKLNGNAALGSPVSASPATPTSIAARLDALFASFGNASSGASSQSFANGGGGGFGLDQDRSTQPAVVSQDPTQTSSLESQNVPSFTAQLSMPLHLQSQLTPVHVDTSAVLEQMVKSMVMRTNAEGTSEIKLHLQPENLGDVTMKISVSGSQISASVVASNSDVRATLLDNHQQLARSLADAGMTLTGFSVDVSGGDSGRRNAQDQTKGFGRRYTVHEIGTAPAETPALATLAPPIMSGSGLELFNYLV